MDNNKIQLFERKRIRSVWVESEEGNEIKMRLLAGQTLG